MKQYRKGGGGDVKTGTPNFWSVEVAAEQWLFDRISEDSPSVDNMPSMESISDAVSPPFQHTPLHDVEFLSSD
ncbi:hypothetical protein CPB83DRAFT_848952 [Crepidotus variabilis]|uniref:Uncharacterized protein n=1 Tax=Crepidotus variabilis TaxID=179855 RepID=A0A9P6JRZ5_9AGAR|nr:hypothetical protein CPB83DRAFT_848952 [Crepidotus variabilis]